MLRVTSFALIIACGLLGGCASTSPGQATYNCDKTAPGTPGVIVSSVAPHRDATGKLTCE